MDGQGKNVNEVIKACTIVSTHVVNWVIASHTEMVRSFNSLPFNPRLRAVQTLAQTSPSAT